MAKVQGRGDVLALNVEIVCQDPLPSGVRLVELMIGGMVFCRGYFPDTAPQHIQADHTKRTAEWARYNALAAWGELARAVTGI